MSGAGLGHGALCRDQTAQQPFISTQRAAGGTERSPLTQILSASPHVWHFYWSIFILSNCLHDNDDNWTRSGSYSFFGLLPLGQHQPGNVVTMWTSSGAVCSESSHDFTTAHCLHVVQSGQVVEQVGPGALITFL